MVYVLFHIPVVIGTRAVLTVSDAMPSAHQRVNFTCQIQPSHYQPPEYNHLTWYRDDQQLTDWPSNSSTHTLTVTPADSGLYSCLSETGPIRLRSAPVKVIVSSKYYLTDF